MLRRGLEVVFLIQALIGSPFLCHDPRASHKERNLGNGCSVVREAPMFGSAFGLITAGTRWFRAVQLAAAGDLAKFFSFVVWRSIHGPLERGREGRS